MSQYNVQLQDGKGRDVLTMKLLGALQEALSRIEALEAAQGGNN